MEFQPLLDAAAPGPSTCRPRPRWLRRGRPSARRSPSPLLDLTAFDAASVRAAADLVVDAPGAVNAVAVTFRAALHGAIEHTLDPWTWPTSSWATSVWVLPDPLHVGPGAALRVHYNRRVRGTPDGLTCEVVEGAAVSRGDSVPTGFTLFG